MSRPAKCGASVRSSGTPPTNSRLCVLANAAQARRRAIQLVDRAVGSGQFMATIPVKAATSAHGERPERQSCMPERVQQSHWTFAAGTAIGLGASASGLAHSDSTNAPLRSKFSAAIDT
jgi:hypothetical protein